MSDSDEYGQPIGPALPGWTCRPLPSGTPLSGRYCRLEKLSAEAHAAELYAAHSQAADDRHWSFLVIGPFPTFADFAAYTREVELSKDELHFAVLELGSGRAVGSAALMRVDAANGAMEVGFVHYAPCLQRGRAGTEAQFLLMRRCFDELGYRRYEWKCDSLNAASRRAALRLGFQYEGCFRQAVVYKGRSRDTAWYAVIDADWPGLSAAFQRWLDDANFDAAGRQLRSLAGIRAELTLQLQPAHRHAKDS